ncbi:DNA-binding transcriptional regulator, MerR family [Paenibacillus uliginis N3/975]|uniref:DNA-binding transcriptional regulator, MerR family n=1 Tax=Paenibacillus uliginis N3/975 TaxID=1313296 RepID=A0A1X7GZ83_9BACL|nr:effector binding domain-containing protein [Paenibacillus uliginis]SMF77067.1 DNA-binding transcriptional regulator, MerR family [Paenibacillus uliginis N3/975]
MELQTISEVTKSYQISTRTLRYYEQIGLLQSSKKEGYAYRTYDEDSLKRLEQILILRKLRIPLKEIQSVLQSKESRIAIAVFQDKIEELSNEITALSAVRTVLEQFVIVLRDQTGLAMNLGFADEKIRQMIETLPGIKTNLKEEVTMNDLNMVDNQLSQLKDVRIVYLPPSTVASIQLVGGTPEYDTGVKLQQFMIQTNLASLKLDLRHYGFNHPNGVKPDGSDHGYERWVTIPDDMEVNESFVKKKFPGGLYAAHMIPMGNFEEWGWLTEWVNNNSNEYEPNWGDPDCMNGSMEEHLNYINQYKLSNEEMDKIVQLDLLLPIKTKLK